MRSWVHSDAELANSLTKDSEQHQLDLLMSNGCKWLIMYDEKFESAKKRKKQGVQAFRPAQRSAKAIFRSQEDQRNSSLSSIFELLVFGACNFSQRSESSCSVPSARNYQPQTNQGDSPPKLLKCSPVVQTRTKAKL